MWRIVLVGWWLLGCGASAPPSATAESAAAESAPAESAAAGESEACRTARLATLDAMATSRESACTVDADCAVVTGPGHPDPEYGEVVAARDAASLDARAEAHLSTCGAFHHHEAIDAVRVIEAACEAGRCAARETTLHLSE